MRSSTLVVAALAAAILATTAVAQPARQTRRAPERALVQRGIDRPPAARSGPRSGPIMWNTPNASGNLGGPGAGGGGGGGP